jgi:hypothetical protein
MDESFAFYVEPVGAPPVATAVAAWTEFTILDVE